MQITLCELNAENLFISLDHFEGGSLENVTESQWRRFALPQLRTKQKPINKLWGLSSAILDINPDILMLIEVGGEDSLKHFNHHFLNNGFDIHFVESNSDRSIDLAFLIKKNFPFSLRTASNRHSPVEVKAYQGEHTARFSRDVAELHLSQDENLRLIILLTHLKSKISTDWDPKGKDRRTAEAAALTQIYTNLAKKHPHVPIVVGGDFNADLSSPELELIKQTNLTDFHDLLGSNLETRTSLVHFDYKGVPHPQVLDYLMVSPHLCDKIVRDKSQTYRYKSFYDIPHPLPKTIHDRYHMPSDHYPLVLTLDI